MTAIAITLSDVITVKISRVRDRLCTHCTNNVHRYRMLIFTRVAERGNARVDKFTCF